MGKNCHEILKEECEEVPNQVCQKVPRVNCPSSAHKKESKEVCTIVTNLENDSDSESDSDSDSDDEDDDTEDEDNVNDDQRATEVKLNHSNPSSPVITTHDD